MTEGSQQHSSMRQQQHKAARLQSANKNFERIKIYLFLFLIYLNIKIKYKQKEKKKT